MKDKNKVKKEVITGFFVNRESIYYSVLFTLAFMVSIALLVIAKSKSNKGLVIYSAILIPLFFIATAVAIRCVCISKNKIHVKGGKLVIKTFFITRRIPISAIKKLTVAQFGDKNLTSVKLSLRDKAFRYKFKSFTKEEAAHLRRAISK